MQFKTAADVDRLPIKSTRYEAVDAVQPGVRVRVTPSGAKSYSYLYRIKGERRKRRITFGTVRKFDLAGVRTLARGYAVLAEQGIDPADEKRQRRQAERDAVEQASARRTVAELGKLYLDDVTARQAASTAANARSRWTRFVVPAIGALSPDAVTRRHIAALHREIPVKTTTAEGEVEVGKTTANRVVELLSAFFAWCVEQGYCPEGTAPTRRIKKYDEESVERFLQGPELARLLAALDTAETIGLPAAPNRQRKEPDPSKAKHSAPANPDKKNRARGSVAPANPYALAALRLLLLSGWREQEVMTLRWDALDMERRVATLQGTKAGKSQRILSASSVALLDGLPRHKDSPWCFPSPRSPKRPIADVGRLWDAVRHAAGLKGFRLHDLRHSAASFAIGAGASLAVIGKMLGHKNSATTARYAHLADHPVRAATEAVASTIAAASAAKPTAVTPLHKQAAR